MLIGEFKGKHMRFLMIYFMCLLRTVSYKASHSAQNTPEANLTPAVKLKYLVILSPMFYNGTVSFYWNQSKIPEHKAQVC